MFLALALATVSGCTASGASQRPPGSPRPQEYSVPRTVVTPDDVASIPELYARAAALAAEGRHAAAALAYARVHELDPAGEFAERALFESASEHDLAEQFEKAAVTYEQLARMHPKSALATTTLVRATRLRAHLEQWQHAGELAERVLSFGQQLGPLEHVTVYAASALLRLEQGDERAAQTFIEKGREVVDEYRLGEAGTLLPELAPLYFALGELRRRRSERIVFEPLPPDFADALERRCQLLLDAHGAYSDTMRAYNTHWSSMAGYRVGELYSRLHRDVMRVTPPASADSEEKRILFEAAMRMRYSVLLDKAQQFMEHTLGWAERNGERSQWVSRAHEAIAEIRAAAQREKAALDALPYSRATLEAALLDLQRRTLEKERARARPTGTAAP